MNERDIFIEALQRPDPADRREYLELACAGDDGLRRRVEDLLAAFDKADGFLREPSAAAVVTADFPSGPRAILPEFDPRDASMGPYKLLEQIGEGGMGSVYAAEQTHPVRRKVALKIIKPGMDTKQVIARFEAERQALALMDHPNIARVLDAGATHSGRPYFVMELVRGVPITDYCDKARLSVSERLDLFVLICRAVQHAHQKGIIRRDLKPSNILVTLIDGAAVPKVIDFGVAKATGGAIADRTVYTGFAQLVGTPLYMSPEQAEFSGVDVDTRSDVYALGVLLYELLTGSTPIDRESLARAAYAEVCRIVREHETPAPSTRLGTLGVNLGAVSANRRSDPRRLGHSLRGELDWVVMKALEKDRGRRYETAAAFAADVRRHLQHEPVEAGPPSAWYRLRKAAPRHRLALTAAAGVAVALVAVSALAVAHERTERWNSLVQQLQRVRLTAHAAGWSDKAWSLARQAAALSRDDGGALQAEAAASLGGLDARAVKAMPFAATSLKFDPRGGRLYMAGPAGLVGFWDALTDRRDAFGPVGDGPFAFRADGTACQLGWSPSEPDSVRVHDLNPGGPVRRLAMPAGYRSPPRAWDITPDASRAAASLSSDRGRCVVAVWDAASGRLVRAIETDRADEVALAPDGSLVAAVTGDGAVTVWALPGGAAVASLKSRDVRVNCLAFERDQVRPGAIGTGAGGGKNAGEGWLLAAGDAGGLVAVYDLRIAAPRSFCRGSHHDVFAVAFSPDGMTLASAGREQAKLWDVATGRRLLDLGDRNTMNALAFSPDGRRLAVASQAVFAPEPSVDVWELDEARGIGKLRGLQGVVEKVVFSPDGRRVAGLSIDWQVGIWECPSGRLLHVLDLPPGRFADNAGLAFSPDGRRFAASAGRDAACWDLDTGRVVRSWALAEGLQESLRFLGPDRLLLARAETREGLAPPYGSDPKGHPRVCRVRDLLAREPLRPLAEVSDYPNHVHRAELSPDGRWLVVAGVGAGGPAATVAAYDASTGGLLWRLPAGRSPYLPALVAFAPSGSVLGLDATGRGLDLLTMPSGAAFGRIDPLVVDVAIAPGGRRWMGQVTGEPSRSLGRAFGELGRARPHFALPADLSPSSTHSEFSPDGRRFAWGEPDGSVAVFDLGEIERRLAAVGLRR